jgi:nickel-dependent lactate racemase
MTPKEKAIELVNSCNELAKDFTRGVSMNEFSKQFALLMVSELIKEESKTDDYYEIGSYWYDVKLEINKL